MDRFESRKFIVLAIFITIGIIFLVRIFYIQVIDTTYRTSADNQALRYVTEYPSRGVMFDRNGKLLVYNEVAYDLMVVPRQVNAQMDTLEFCKLIGIDTVAFNSRLQTAKSYSRYKASAFERQIPANQWADITTKLYKYPGFYGEQRSLRRYPDSTAAHVLGYVGEVDKKHIEKDSYYKMGDYIGISGLEKSYESDLRGKRGLKVLMVDVHNTIKGSYLDGALDSLPVPGKNIVTTIDRDLQKYGEILMRNKRGSIVAIEPATGEILAMVSSPGYDPNLLVGRQRAKNYVMLVRDTLYNPLFNRALNAVYRPGSIFKLVQSLVGLQNNVITPATRIPCNRRIIACHGSHTNDDLHQAIQHSCNPYFHQVYKRLIQQGKSKSMFEDAAIGLENWENYVRSFGLGERLETDLPTPSKGHVPNVSFYNRWYGEKRWAFSTIYSNSIGEGELGVVPLQMANLMCIFANKGYYYTPHFVKQIANQGKRNEFTQKNNVLIDSNHFNVVIDAMSAVVNQDGGTARRARIDSIEVCGKTGTVQNKNKKDHSVFVAFAPRANPQIAIAVYVEYSGFGGTWAAPIASLMMEKYLKGEVRSKEKEQYILEADFINKVLIK